MVILVQIIVFENAISCDELIIGKMGASCDCNYFNGMLDDISISSYDIQEEDWHVVTTWNFDEGKGNLTYDQDLRAGTIHGAYWVMPDGSLVGQAIRLENDESYVLDTNHDTKYLFLLNSPIIQHTFGYLLLVNFVEVCSPILTFT